MRSYASRLSLTCSVQTGGMQIAVATYRLGLSRLVPCQNKVLCIKVEPDMLCTNWRHAKSKCYIPIGSVPSGSLPKRRRMSAILLRRMPIPIISWQEGMFTPEIHSVTGCSTCIMEQVLITICCCIPAHCLACTLATLHSFGQRHWMYSTLDQALMAAAHSFGPTSIVTGNTAGCFKIPQNTSPA